ncbi:hypothetical protein OO013_04690 [Mangrovivirga sp. M17]|uniref:DUF6671 domain-containing protein n=1 Tax=Mangrovivirga halotolerans TaxID=2993936 RepID=A0ABT3RNP6_9BACT|nr:DUF6671 family protein [Mangrovivirga halotolerans]MCX2743148.1 hypothetical protein [Mangrovivirga halotolerans]
MEFFKNRTVTLATKHKKERVIGPLLNHFLKTDYLIPDGFDTDVFGTFSGEVERQGTPLETARQKCLQAMEITGTDIAIASEGSFGMHPSLPFVNSDEEWVLLVDRINNIEVFEKELSVSTNYNRSLVQNFNELQEFAEHVGFPEHGLILKSTEKCFKGITDKDILNFQFEELLKKSGKVEVLTDMRANFNPSRMEVIKKATYKLMSRLKCLCPKCNVPGFGITDYEAGLPCSLCSFPTSGIKTYIYSCANCDYVIKEANKNKKAEDPTYCDQCNP